MGAAASATIQGNNRRRYCVYGDDGRPLLRVRITSLQPINNNHRNLLIMDSLMAAIRMVIIPLVMMMMAMNRATTKA
jgi:hypothetical protein